MTTPTRIYAIAQLEHDEFVVRSFQFSQAGVTPVTEVTYFEDLRAARKHVKSLSPKAIKVAPYPKSDATIIESWL